MTPLLWNKCNRQGGPMSDQMTLDQFLETEFPAAETSVFRDLSVNFKKLMEESPLDETDRWMNLLAIATSLENKKMMLFAEEQLKERDLTMEQIREARESAGIMGMLNTYYKFKSFLAPEAVELYQRAGLRMQSLMKPINGKEKFEMMAFSVSVVNGCPTCVASHERALFQLQVSADKIHDLAKLAAVCKGLTALKKASF